MKTIMIPTTNKLYKIPNYKTYELPNKVVDYIKQLEEENKNHYFVHMKEWAKAVGNNVKLRQIIDKAIEYIEENKPIVNASAVEDILKGDQDEDTN